MAGTSMQQRRDPAATWATNNPVLKAGEMGYTTDTHIVKFGDGATAWNSLSGIAYMPLSNTEALPVPGSVVVRTSDGTIRAAPADEANEVVILSQTTGFCRDRGSGTSWPATDNRRGDVYYRSDVAQMGYYNGAAWRLIGSGTIATVALRNAINWAYVGLRILVTADNIEYTYVALAGGAFGWTALNHWIDVLDGSVAPTNQALTTTGGAVLTNSAFTSLAVPVGKSLVIEGKWPRMHLFTSTVAYARIQAVNNGITGYADGNDYANPSTTVNMAVPIALSGLFRGTGHTMAVRAEAWYTTGSGGTVGSSLAGQNPTLRYRIE